MEQIQQLFNDYYLMKRTQMFCTIRNIYESEHGMKEPTLVMKIKRMVYELKKVLRKVKHKTYFLPTLMGIRYKKMRKNIQMSLLFWRL